MKQSPLPSALLIAIVILLVPVLTFALSPSKVTLNFMCPCGACDEALSTCECPQSDGFRAEIAAMVGRGFSEEQIVQDFRGRFGPSILIANAAMRPNSGDPVSKSSSKKTFGFILLLASFSLVAFSLGKYRKAPSPALSKRSSKRSSGAPGKQTKGKGKRGNRQGKGFRDGVDDDLLDD